MNDPIALLKKDHREVEVMLKALLTSKPGVRRQATVKKLDAALSLHMSIEEAHIYPLVAKRVDEDEEAGIEQGLGRAALANLKELVAEPGFGAALAMLTAGIKHHVKEEEQEVFPELKRTLDRGEFAELGDEVAEAKKASRRSAR
jgi:hemerythrin-like domain-containing protein